MERGEHAGAHAGSPRDARRRAAARRAPAHAEHIDASRGKMHAEVGGIRRPNGSVTSEAKR
ncbi:hypothetical protein D7S86_21755 [Pararobbsia silviterrae]|uniref:Uncharacterized protein n=1 Tax=Pararobbsia silviterrae TaxID=1792498 RepID=A0A494XG12_9BURK|nr:hypothetical protein D7S86_21755 [Pararobbsia silviterrae]